MISGKKDLLMVSMLVGLTAAVIFAVGLVRKLDQRINLLESRVAERARDESDDISRQRDLRLERVENTLSELQTKAAYRMGPSLIDPPIRSIRETPFSR